MVISWNPHGVNLIIKLKMKKGIQYLKYDAIVSVWYNWRRLGIICQQSRRGTRECTGRVLGKTVVDINIKGIAVLCYKNKKK